MKKVILSMLAVSALVFTSCSEDGTSVIKTPEQIAAEQAALVTKEISELTVPATYEFKDADGKSTVSYSGQEARLRMANELKSLLGNSEGTKTPAELQTMFKEGTGFTFNGFKVNKKLRKTVASATNSTYPSTKQEELRDKMDGWIALYDPKAGSASEGKAGLLGSKKRVVTAKGIEVNQAVAKTMIGAIMLDQIVNKYASEAGLKADVAKGDEAKLAHHWDEAYGYVYGTVSTKNKDTGVMEMKPAFLGKYLGSVEKMDAFKGISAKVETAFRIGRAAIVAKKYNAMHAQAAIIRAELSKVVAVRAVHYLLTNKTVDTSKTRADEIHALSEGYGFVHALMFAHANGSQIDASHVEPVITYMEKDNGLWSVEKIELAKHANHIAEMFGFTAAQAK